MKRSCNSTTVKIEHRNIRRPRIGNVGAVAVGRYIDKEGASVDADGGNDFILLGVDHAEVRGTSIHDVHFVALGIGRHSGRLVTDLQRANRAKAAQVDNRHRIALAVRDVGILAVERAVAGKGALVEVVPAGG